MFHLTRRDKQIRLRKHSTGANGPTGGFCFLLPNPVLRRGGTAGCADLIPRRVRRTDDVWCEAATPSYRDYVVPGTDGTLSPPVLEALAALAFISATLRLSSRVPPPHVGLESPSLKLCTSIWAGSPKRVNLTWFFFFYCVMIKRPEEVPPQLGLFWGEDTSPAWRREQNCHVLMTDSTIIQCTAQLPAPEGDRRESWDETRSKINPKKHKIHREKVHLITKHHITNKFVLSTHTLFIFWLFRSPFKQQIDQKDKKKKKNTSS